MPVVSQYAVRMAQRIGLIPADTYPTPTVTSCSPSSTSHLGGSTITITGTGFKASWGDGLVQSVYFGSTLATSFAIVSATSMTAVAPAHAVGAVTIVVNTLGGCARKLSGVTFT